MRLFVLTVIGFALLANTNSLWAADDWHSDRWSVEKAKDWHEKYDWLVGCNFIPSSAINQLEMWQAETFDPVTIDRELGYAKSIGFNFLRVYLHDLAYQQDSEGFMDRMEAFLEIAERHGMTTLFVFFDDCHIGQMKTGTQPKPLPGRHNSGWVQSPGYAVVQKASHDATIQRRLKQYMQAVLKRFKDDKRIYGWDLYNEPGNVCRFYPDKNGVVKRGPSTAKESAELVKLSFQWARQINPSQPLTVGQWRGTNFGDINSKLALGLSDIISFHNYSGAGHLTNHIEALKRVAASRPIICTEYMARTSNSTFEGTLPVFAANQVAAVNWGLVAGKSNTIYPWSTYDNPGKLPEPDVWFHDVFRVDGSPYSQKEIDFIRQITREIRSQNGASTREVILPTSQKTPAVWRYTFQQPAADWVEPGFNDISWKSGNAPFGTSSTPGLRPGTEWNGPDIWLRREFEFAGNADKIQLLLAEIFHDEDAEVYINGTSALKVSGYTTSYVLTPVDSEGRMSLKTGNNVIAVHCRQTSGGQGIDVGLVAASPAKVTLKAQTCKLKTQRINQRTGLSLEANGQVLLTSPREGLWSVATDWKDDWPTDWAHGSPQMVERQGPWLVMNGSVRTDEGNWEIRDSYIAEGRLIRGVRRWIWMGKKPAKQVSLTVRFQSPDSGAAIFMPGICYYGNPADKPPRVARFNGKPGEELLCEEHRFAMPFASLEWDLDNQFYGAALHTMPSLTPFANVSDQWWSLGGIGRESATELTLLSGSCSLNGQRSFVKANQGRSLKYPDMWMDVPPGAVIEKTFYLEAYPVTAKGKGFQHSIRSSVELFHPYNTDGLPTFDEILEAKYRFTVSRWHEDAESAGIRMYPHNNEYVMGWAGQSGAPGYALLALSQRLGDTKAVVMAQRLLDHLATSPFNENGFMVRYNPDQNRWYGQDPISQGQGMENFARAIMTGRKMDNVNTSKWEAFLKKACDIHAARILDSKWRPRSTNQGFLVSPLCKAYTLFGNEVYKRAATKAAEHYAQRHLDMTEPYWGGTLDARCEDKEGAWAGFQAFLAMYEMTQDKKYLDWTEHAMDVTLSYTVVWDIDMPPGRMRDHNFKSRGWTVVSAQNQHLDVYGVLYTPEVYRMGEYLGREDLKKLAIVMYRSCGQLIDPLGSQGEQIQQTNFAQHGNMSDVTRMRGGYSEGWTVYWITAHFLNAAAQFQEMGVLK